MLTSIYVHIPFCVKRCNYCDFNTYAGKTNLIDSYVNVLCNEIYSFSNTSDIDPVVHTIYFGGGTPSLISVSELQKILMTIKTKFNVHENMEISMEVNPGTINGEYLTGIRSLGVNRLSIGMQSIQPQELTNLARIHTIYDVINTVKWSRLAGFENINLDLIFGIPGQNLSDWKRTLEFALKLNPEHFSLYSLILEPETPLYYWYKKGLLPLVNDDLVADMYELADNLLEMSGYKAYEISNWMKIDPHDEMRYACIHNMQYWLYKPYIGFGLSAHSYFNNSRSGNIHDLQKYLSIGDKLVSMDNKLTNASEDIILIDREKEIEETMIMGLRLTEMGVSNERFKNRFRISLMDEYPEEIKMLREQGLVEFQDDQNPTLRLSKRGRLLGNHVFRTFLR